MFCTVGFINAFGVFEEYYTSSLLASKSASDIAWIGSFELFVMFGGTLPVGFLSDKYGPRVRMSEQGTALFSFGWSERVEMQSRRQVLPFPRYMKQVFDSGIRSEDVPIEKDRSRCL